MRVLSRVSEAVYLSASDLYNKVGESSQEKLRKATTPALLAYYVRDNEEIAEAAREALRDRLNVDPQSRFTFAQTVFPIDEMRARLKNRMSQAEIALRANFRELHDEIDRTRAEGEFRKGICFPIAALLTAVSASLAKAFAAQRLDEITLAAATVSFVVALIIYAAGARRTKEANQLLYACLLQNIVGVTRENLYGKQIFVPAESIRITPLPGIRHKLAELLRERATSALEGAIESTKKKTRVPATANIDPTLAQTSLSGPLRWRELHTIKRT